MSRSSSTKRTMLVECLNSAPREVEVFITFREVIDGKRFDFAVTQELNGIGQCVTEVRSGRKVCALGVGAAYLPAYAKLRGTSYATRGLMSLRALIDKHGAKRVREVMEAAPKLDRGVTP